MRKLFEIGGFFAAAGTLKDGEPALRFMRRTPKDLAPPVIPVA